MFPRYVQTGLTEAGTEYSTGIAGGKEHYPHISKETSRKQHSYFCHPSSTSGYLPVLLINGLKTGFKKNASRKKSF